MSMASVDRLQMLAGLGLVDWRIRRDGPLAVDPRADRPAHAEVPPKTVAGPDPAPPEPAEHDKSTRDSSPTANTISGQAQVPTQAAGEGQAATSPRAAEADDPRWPDDVEADRAAALHAEMTDEGVTDVDDKAPAVSVTGDMDWAQLEAWLAEQDHRGAQRPVFGVGARDADVLIVGEAPGASEDEQGVPFVGRSGKLLDRMLAAIDCSRDTNVYITNICKFRPPDNRDPNADEVAADWPVLERQIELMNPKLVVAVGRVAAQTLLGSTEALGKLRGQLHRYPQRELDVLVTYHPSYLLRSPQQKAKAWDDLRQIAGRIRAAAS